MQSQATVILLSRGYEFKAAQFNIDYVEEQINKYDNWIESESSDSERMPQLNESGQFLYVTGVDRKPQTPF